MDPLSRRSDNLLSSSAQRSVIRSAREVLLTSIPAPESSEPLVRWRTLPGGAGHQAGHDPAGLLSVPPPMLIIG